MSDTLENLMQGTSETPQKSPPAGSLSALLGPNQSVQDQARKTLVQHGADHGETADSVQAKEGIANALSGPTGQSPEWIHQNTATLSRHLFGKEDAPLTLWDKVKNSAKSASLQAQIIGLQGEQAKNKTVDPQLQAKIDALDKQLPTDKEMAGSVPNFIASTVAGMGSYLWDVGQEGVHEGLALTHALFPWATNKPVVQEVMKQQAPSQMIGSIYQTITGLKDANGNQLITHDIARRYALTLGGAMDVLGVLPVGDVAAQGAEAALRGLALSGALKTVVRGAAAGGTFMGAQQLSEIAAEHMAKNMANLVDGAHYTQDKLLSDLKRMGISLETGVAVGGVAGGISAGVGLARSAIGGGVKVVPGGVLDTSMRRAEAEATREPAVSAARETPAIIEPKKTVSQVLETAPRAEVATGKSWDEASVASRLAQEEVRAESLRGKDTELAKAQLSEAEYNIKVLNSDISPETKQRIVGEPPTPKETPKLTEAQGEALDAATKSSEGTEDYIAHDPVVERLTKNIEDLTAKLSTTKEEARTTLQNRVAQLTEAKKQAVSSIRSQIAQRAHVNKLESDIAGVEKAFASKFKGMEEKYTAPVRKILDAFQQHRPSERTLEGLRELRTAIEDQPEANFSKEELQRLSRLDKTAYKDLPIEDMQIVHDALMSYLHVASGADKIRVRGEQLDREVAIRNSVEELGKAHERIKVKVSTDATLGERIKNIENALMQGTRAQIFQYDTLVNHLFGGERSTGYDVLGRALDEAADHENDLIYGPKAYSKPIQEWFDAKKLNANSWLGKAEDVPVPGEDRTVTVTRRHKLSAWGLMQQEGGPESLANGVVISRSGNKYAIQHFPKEFFQSLVDSITPEEQDFIDNAFANMTQQTWEESRQAFFDVNGRYPTAVDGFYYPFYRVKTQVGGSASPNDLMAQQMGRNKIVASVDKGHLIERVDSTAPVYWRGIDDDIADIVSFSAKYTAFARTAKNAARLLYSPQLEQAMNERFNSRKPLQSLKKGFSAILGETTPLSGPERALENIRGLGVNLILSFRATTAVINAVLGIRASQYVPYADMFLGSMNTLAHPINTGRMLNSVTHMYGEMSRRGGDFAQEAARQAPSKIVRGISRVTMAPITLGVKTAGAIEMSGSMHQFIREAKKGALSVPVENATGLTGEQAHRLWAEGKTEELYAAAGKYADYVTKRTHAVPRAQYRAGLTREGFVGRWAMTLGSEMNAGLNMIFRGIGERQTAGGYRRLMKAAFVMAIAEPFIIGLVHRNSLPYLEGKKKRPPLADTMAEEAARQVTGGLPFGSDIAYGIEAAASTGRRQSGVITGVQGQYIDDMVNLSGEAWRWQFAPNAWERQARGQKFLEDFVNSLAGRKVNLPFTGGSDPTGTWTQGQK